MAVNVYEGLFILHSNRYASDPAGLTGDLEKLIGAAGGELLASRLWDERRLAYPIRGQRKGTYWLTYFRMEGPQLVGLNRQCEINDKILRHLVVKVDPRLVEALVEHANAPPASSRPPASDAPAKSGDATGGEPPAADSGAEGEAADASSGSPGEGSKEEVAAP